MGREQSLWVSLEQQPNVCDITQCPISTHSHCHHSGMHSNLYRVSLLIYRVGVLIYRVSVLIYRVSVLIYRVSVLIYRISVLIYRVNINTLIDIKRCNRY